MKNHINAGVQYVKQLRESSEVGKNKNTWLQKFGPGKVTRVNQWPLCTYVEDLQKPQKMLLKM